MAEELSDEERELIRAERKQQVLAGLRTRIAGMSGAHARARSPSALSQSLTVSLSPSFPLFLSLAALPLCCVVRLALRYGSLFVDEEFQEFLEAFGDAIVDSTSREVDRLEVGIKKILPDARTVDFETH